MASRDHDVVVVQGRFQQLDGMFAITPPTGLIRGMNI